MNRLEGSYAIDSHQEDCIALLLEEAPSLRAYVHISPGQLLINNLLYAGAGMTFLVEALVSLIGTNKVELRKGGILDRYNARAFVNLLRRYYTGLD